MTIAVGNASSRTRDNTWFVASPVPREGGAAVTRRADPYERSRPRSAPKGNV